MKNIIQQIGKFAEYYLILLVLLAAYTPPFSVNPFLLGVMFLITLQIMFKNKIAGLILAILFLISNLYMILALVSEFKEFPIVNAEAIKLLLVGLGIISVNAMIGVLMLVKYSKEEKVLQQKN